ncbi:11858_t:CDS:1, partial [Gigaspora rosea]
KPEYFFYHHLNNGRNILSPAVLSRYETVDTTSDKTTRYVTRPYFTTLWSSTNNTLQKRTTVN